MKDPITLILADDHLMFTDTLKSWLNRQNNLKVVATAVDGVQLIELVTKHKPKLVLTDIKMHKMDGIEAVKQLKHRFPQLRVIVLSNYNSLMLIEKLKTLGAEGYISKNAPLKILAQAIATVASGGVYYEPSEKKPIGLTKKHELLTPRETQILDCIACGLSSAAIALQLGISNDTVESHRKNMLRKIGLVGKSALLRYAISYRQDYDNNG